MFAGDKVVRLNYIFIREHADCVNKEPKDMIASMRWPVALVLVVGWNAPVLYYPRFSLSSAGLYRFIGLQVGILVVFFLLVALSATLHRLVFRSGVPDFYFRRRLLILAGVYSLVCAVLLVVSYFTVR